MRFLVTGGAGFIGSHLVERLVCGGLGEVVVLDNLYRGSMLSLASCLHHIHFHQNDVRNAAQLRRSMKGCDAVFHLAAQSNVMGAAGDLDYSFSSNVTGTLEVLKAARECGVRRVIFTSSREVYGEPGGLPVPESAPLRPKNAYGASKAAAEMYCRIFRRDLEMVVLRLANVYGTRDRGRVIPVFLERALRGEPLELYGGGQLLDFVWVGAVVDALISAALEGYIDRPVNIGSGTGIRLPDLARRIVELAHSQSPVNVLPGREIEVGSFVADTTAARHYFPAMERFSDPLAGLPQVLEWTRRQDRVHQSATGGATSN